MDFIVLPYSIESPIIYWNTMQPPISKDTKYNQPNCKLSEYFTKMHYFSLRSINLNCQNVM